MVKKVEMKKNEWRAISLQNGNEVSNHLEWIYHDYYGLQLKVFHVLVSVVTISPLVVRFLQTMN
jgi:hypothetical protein